MREHLKAVVWPRQKTGKPDKVDVRGTTTIGIQLESATQRETEYPLGDATDVLLSLEDL